MSLTRNKRPRSQEQSSWTKLEKLLSVRLVKKHRGLFLYQAAKKLGQDMVELYYLT